MVSDHLLHQDEARAVMGAGVEAVRSVSDRFERIGNFCATGDELKRIGDALNLCDELQTITTRKEQEASLCAVLSISKQKLDLLSRT